MTNPSDVSEVKDLTQIVNGLPLSDWLGKVNGWEPIDGVPPLGAQRVVSADFVYCYCGSIPGGTWKRLILPSSVCHEPAVLAVPGWRLVPVEPDDAMKLAGGNRVLREGGCHRASAQPSDTDIALAESVFDAMLAAAPAIHEGGEG